MEIVTENDWREEVFQKIRSMKNMFLPHLDHYHHTAASLLHRKISLPQHKFEKMKQWKTMLEGMIRLLSLSKNSIPPHVKYKLDDYENEIVSMLKTDRLGKTGMLPIFPTVEDQSHGNQKNPQQMQSKSMQDAGSMAQQSKQDVVQPLLEEFTSPDGNITNPLTDELPAIERLVRAVQSISPQALSCAVSDFISVVSMVDEIDGLDPENGSRALVGEDLAAMTKCRLQARNFMTQEGMMSNKKRKRYTTAIPQIVASLGGSLGDNYKQFAGLETSDLESTATSNGKKARTEIEHALLEEIEEINQQLIDTVVDISDEEDTSSEVCEGTTVRFSFTAVSLGPALKAHLSSKQMSPIQPLRLLVPCSYPNSSPYLLDKLPVETSKENEDLSSKAMARFKIFLEQKRSLSQEISLKDIAKTWDACARGVICEYAQQFGGGTFSSKYSTWDKFVAAS